MPARHANEERSIVQRAGKESTAQDIESEGARSERESGVVRCHDGQGTDPFAPDERRCQMHGVQRAERRRERIAGSAQHRWPQHDKVDRFKPFRHDLQAFRGFLRGERPL